MFKVCFDSAKKCNDAVKVVYFKQASKLDFSKAAKVLNKEELETLKNAAKQSRFEGKAGTFAVTYTAKSKIIACGLGEKDKALDFAKMGGSLVKQLFKDSAAVVYAESVDAAYNIALGMELGSYSFDKYFTTKKKEEFAALEQVCFVVAKGTALAKGYADFQAEARCVSYVRDLVNEPANLLTPKIYAEDIARLAHLGLEVEVLEQKQLEKLGMGLLLGVAKGSVNEPRVVIVKWNGNKAKKDFDWALVGKGVTFDSGGIDIKPSAGMDEMKGDMAGSAAVVGALKLAALQKLKVNLVGAVGLVENMPSGKALKPSDVLVSMSGKTVEIGNTDAEGRLVLADVLWYVQDKLKVKKIVDIATLTGASQYALGKKYASIMGNDEKLIKDLTAAGLEIGEKLWQMPLDAEHEKMIKSAIADMNNIATNGSGAGMSAAAAFLQKFIQKGVKWAHVDMAGMELQKEVTPLCPKGATGFGVRLFGEFLRTQK